jgi:hypothetical protein
MNKEPTRSFYTRGSTIHHGLENISRKPMTEQEWRTQTKSISMVRFHMYVISPLKKDWFVVNHDGFWRITSNGEARLSELGATRTRRVSTKTEPHYTMLTTYDGNEIKLKPAREHAEDFLNYPSRINNCLFYRNGSVEVMA